VIAALKVKRFNWPQEKKKTKMRKSVLDPPQANTAQWGKEKKGKRTRISIAN